jgi:ATP-binding cassette, subfamily C (CFTR/MRP), member 1
LVLPEEHDEGAVEGKLLWEMVKMCGGILKFGLAAILSLFFYMLSKTGASIMVQLWCNDPSEKSKLYLYIGISVMAVVFMFI